MSVALVTGASGFVGRHAVAALAEGGFTVHAVARRPLADVPAVWHAADLLDAGARQSLMESLRPTHLLHLAWETRHGYFWEAPENLDWVAATLDLVRRFHAGGGKRMVLAGSCAEYDWTPEGLGDGICRERQTPCRPATLYGTAKLAAYELTAAYAARNGLSQAWGRLFLAYGPYEADARLVPSVVLSLLAGERVKLGDGDKRRDFMDARDAGKAFAALLSAPVEGPVNIASGACLTIAEVAGRLEDLLGKEGLLDFGALAPRANDPPHLCADVARLTAEVGFVPDYDPERGLADVVAWWRRGSTQGRQTANPEI